MRICTIITINEQRSGNLEVENDKDGDGMYRRVRWVWMEVRVMDTELNMTARVMGSDGIRRGLRVSFV